MVNAVCFNNHVFAPDVLDRILKETNGKLIGCLGNDSQVNCIESFADGTICYSFCWEAKRKQKDVIDCHNDVEKFIYVNRFNPTKQEKENE